MAERENDTERVRGRKEKKKRKEKREKKNHETDYRLSSVLIATRQYSRVTDDEPTLKDFSRRRVDSRVREKLPAVTRKVENTRSSVA